MIFLGKELIPHKSISIVAEISCSHEQSLDQAAALILKAKECGADAVKIQAYTPDELTIDAPQVDFMCGKGPWEAQTLWELYNKTYTPLEWLPTIFHYAKTVQIPIFASVFGEKSLEALEKVNCPAYKIASFELNDTNLLRLVAQAGKPMVLSTGVATQEEIDRALFEINYVHGGVEIILMHCISDYPAKAKDLQLNKLINYRKMTGIAGFSDHTLTALAAQLAITLGATIIEKHLCLTSTSEDSKFALRPDEFMQFIQDCNLVLEAFKPKELTLESLNYKRSLYVIEDIYKGEVFTTSNIKSIRPGYGLDPDIYTKVIGKKATKTLRKGEALTKDHIEWIIK